jgi:ABC-type thiamin/hydroxymethylpyrimidine transport system permease subunit
MSFLIVLGLGALIGGLIWGILIYFSNIASIILPSVGIALLVSANLFDIFHGLSLSRDMKK